jgi:hypothetical protein
MLFVRDDIGIGAVPFHDLPLVHCLTCLGIRVLGDMELEEVLVLLGNWSLTKCIWTGRWS